MYSIWLVSSSKKEGRALILCEEAREGAGHGVDMDGRDIVYTLLTRKQQRKRWTTNSSQHQTGVRSRNVRSEPDTVTTGRVREGGCVHARERLFGLETIRVRVVARGIA